jgi:hypothetical protein
VWGYGAAKDVTIKVHQNVASAFFFKRGFPQACTFELTSVYIAQGARRSSQPLLAVFTLK